MGIAATSIAFGEISNINNTNNEFTVGVTTKQDQPNGRPINHTEWKLLAMPVGRYERKENVLEKIFDTINDYLGTLDLRVRCSFELSDMDSKAYIDLPYGIVEVLVDGIGPWSLIGAHKEYDEIWVTYGDIIIPNEMAFLYVNIVENSYINGKKSRLLAVFL